MHAYIKDWIADDLAPENEPKMVFLMCDDKSEDYFVGQFSRYPHQVRPEYAALNPGDYLPTSGTTGIMRRS